MKFKFMALIMLVSALFFSACDVIGSGDDNNNSDIISTILAASPSSLFVSKSTLPPGDICPAGGVQIDMGFDVNRNKVLDVDEIVNTEYVCNGEDASSHPFVVYTTHEHPDTEIDRDKPISVVFNTDMDPDTINDTTFTVVDELGTPADGEITCDGIKAVFTPAAPLTGSRYTVTLSSDITSIEDVAMGYDYVFVFTTRTHYNVTFDSRGGSAVAGQSVEYGGTATAPGETTLSGSTFTGWYAEPECVTLWNFPANTVTDDITLYAGWSANQVGSIPIVIDDIGSFTIGGLSRIGWDVEIVETGGFPARAPGEVTVPDITMTSITGSETEVSALKTWVEQGASASEHAITVTLSGLGEEVAVIVLDPARPVSGNTAITRNGASSIMADLTLGLNAATRVPITLSSYQDAGAGYPHIERPGYGLEIEGLTAAGSWSIGSLDIPESGTGGPFFIPGIYTVEELYPWARGVVSGMPERKSGSVIEYNAAGEEVGRTNIFHTWPGQINFFNPGKDYGSTYLIDVMLVVDDSIFVAPE